MLALSLLGALLLRPNSVCKVQQVDSTWPCFLQCVQTKFEFDPTLVPRREFPEFLPCDLPFLAAWLVSIADITKPLFGEFFRFRYSSNRRFWMASSFISVCPSNAVTII